MEIQSVEVRFEGEELATVRSSVSVNTLYRTPEGLYRIHFDEEEIAFLESGRDGEGLTEERVRTLWPELIEAAGL
jgi:hypothetical protein